MANFVIKEMPEGMTEGRKVVYPKMQTYNMHEFETVLKNMHRYAGSFSEGMMRGVLDALVETMKTWMPLGHSIKIDGLGVFTLKLGFDTSTPSEKTLAKSRQQAGDATGEEPKSKYRHICIKGINFKPDARLVKEMNRQATFDRVESGVRVARLKKYSAEERLAIAKGIMERNGYMTLTDYALATEQERSVASRDLKRMLSKADCGITTRGSASHKVWVKSEP